jgi:hypothetical protein
MSFDNIENINRINKIHQTIKSFSFMFPEEFEKCSIKKCGHCSGSGLKNKVDMDIFCSNCKGIGFIGFTKLYGEYICRSCNAAGCDICSKRGTVDWITHAMSSDLRKEASL